MGLDWDSGRFILYPNKDLVRKEINILWNF